MVKRRYLGSQISVWGIPIMYLGYTTIPVGVWGISGINLRYTKQVFDVYQAGIWGCQLGV